MSMMSDRFKSSKSASENLSVAKETTTQKRETKKRRKIRTDEFFVLEQLEGEDFDSADFRLISDLSDTD